MGKRATKSPGVSSHPTVSTTDSNGVRFCFPANWSAECDETEQGETFTLQSPGITFAVLGVFSDDNDPEEMAEAAVETLRQEHPDLELEEIDAGDDFAVEVVFFSLDVITYVWIRSWRLKDKTLFVMVQSVEREQSLSRKVFDGICQSAQRLEG